MIAAIIAICSALGGIFWIIKRATPTAAEENQKVDEEIHKDRNEAEVTGRPRHPPPPP